MADTTTTSIARPAPYLEAAGQNLLDITTGLAGQPIDTSKFAPQIAGQNIFSREWGRQKLCYCKKIFAPSR